MRVAQGRVRVTAALSYWADARMVLIVRRRDLFGKADPYVVFRLLSGVKGAPVTPPRRSPTLWSGGRHPEWPPLEGLLPSVPLLTVRGPEGG